MTFTPQFWTTHVGSVPFLESAALSEKLARTLDVPAWPQLPRRSFRESMYAQFGVHLPGIVFDAARQKAYFDILNLDAYGYLPNLALYPAELRAFLDRGARRQADRQGYSITAQHWRDPRQSFELSRRAALSGAVFAKSKGGEAVSCPARGLLRRRLVLSGEGTPRHDSHWVAAGGRAMVNRCELLINVVNRNKPKNLP
jgi:hypothetical protein